MHSNKVNKIPYPFLYLVTEWMVLGYFAYEMIILKVGAGAAAAIPANLMQGLVGVAASVVLFRLLWQVPALRERFWKG